MAVKLRDRVAGALAWTTDLIQPGRGKAQIRVHDMYLGDIQNHLGRRLSDETPRFAIRAVYFEDDPGGAEPSVTKKRSGLFVVGGTALIFARDAGWSRTLTRGSALDASTAEPVTIQFRGEQLAGLRVAGPERALLALDPAIHGKPGADRTLRDQLVANINGELQAGPNLRILPRSAHTTFVRVVSLPTDGSDVRDPTLKADGTLVIGPGETVLHHGRHAVRCSRHESVAFGNGWRELPVPEPDAEVWITDRGISVVWPDISGRAGVDDLLAIRRRAGFTDQADTRLVAAAHIRAPWISSVFVNRSSIPDGTHAFEVGSADEALPIRLRVLGLDTTLGDHLIRSFSTAVAKLRLEADDSVTDEQGAMLKLIAEERTEPVDLTWGWQIALPSSFKIGRDPASLANVD